MSALEPGALRTPRAAAFAGILFAVLLGGAYIVIRLAIPEGPVDPAEWLAGNVTNLKVALAAVPFAGIAFLWFIGVVRDRLGDREDRFLSTVFFGSGLLFLAMVFASAAIASGLIAVYALRAQVSIDSGVVGFGRDLMYSVLNTYGMRMASVFMVSLATLWIRTATMPRWLSGITYLSALALLLVTTVSLWASLVFPAWVLVVSVYILATGLGDREG